MKLVDIQQVKSNRTKLIDFISDADCDCSISWVHGFILWMQPNNIGLS